MLAGAASAQTGLRSPALPDRNPANPAASSPMRLPSASLPDRTPDQPIPPPRQDVFLAGPDTWVPRPYPIPPYYPYAYGYAPYMTAPDARKIPKQENGYLFLQLQPVTAQVYVDGQYVGTVNDLRRLIPGHPLEAGRRRIELRAPGYVPAAFDARVRPNETIEYRADLEPVSPQAPPRASTVPRPAPKTFYVVPGCYAGDRPPSRRQLPRGCDASKVRAVPPSVMLVARAR